MYIYVYKYVCMHACMYVPSWLYKPCKYSNVSATLLEPQRPNRLKQGYSRNGAAVQSLGLGVSPRLADLVWGLGDC